MEHDHVEDAASLFGTGDQSAADFFSAGNFQEPESHGRDQKPPAVDGQEQETPTLLDATSEDRSAVDLFTAQPVAHEQAADLFASQSEGHGLFDSGAYAAENLVSQAQEGALPQETHPPVQPEEEDWYADSGEPNYDSSYHQQLPDQTTSNSWNGTQHSYDPYAPQQNISSAAMSSQQYYPAYPPQNSYASYEPSGSAHNTYAPASYEPVPTALSQTGSQYYPAYSQDSSTHIQPAPAYAPLAQPSNHQSALGTFGQSPASHIPQSSAEPPKAKDLSAYRSSSFNAYDPPMPKKSRSKLQRALPPMSPPAVPYDAPVGPMTSISPPPPAAMHQGTSVSDARLAHINSQVSQLSYGADPTTHATFQSGPGQERPGSIPPPAHAESYYGFTQQNGQTPESLNTEQVMQSFPTLNPPSAGMQSHEASGQLPHGQEIHQAGSPPVGGDYGASLYEEGYPQTNDGIGSRTTEQGLPSEADNATISALQETPYLPKMSSPEPFPGSSPPLARAQTAYDPYHPSRQASRDSTSSSNVHGSLSGSVTGSPPKLFDPYAPPPAKTNNRRASSSSAHQTPAYRTTKTSTSYSDIHTPTGGVSAVADASYLNAQVNNAGYGYSSSSYFPSIEEPSSEQGGFTDTSNVLNAPTYAPYVPSPSLLGTNDPLGRTSRKVPVISFGFGGKLVTCFHAASENTIGFDVPVGARESTDVYMRTLHEVIPVSAMESSASAFPGPLFSDPGAAALSLARTVGVGAASNIKSKKAQLLKFLDERIEELSSGLGHMTSGSEDRGRAEGALILVRLLRAMVEHDGQLLGSPDIEWAVRVALIPRLESSSADPLASNIPVNDLQGQSFGIAGSKLASFNEPSVAVYQVKGSALDRIQEFLIRGQRREAYHYALDEKLWAHAMIIASSLDTTAWKDVVNEFLSSELAVKQSLSSLGAPRSDSATTSTASNGRESLRVAYSLFAGQGSAAVKELIPPKAAHTMNTLSPPQLTNHLTPISPNFPQPALTSSVPLESLARWPETASVVMFSRASGDSATLTSLGDYLTANRWFEAAHVCYLLSPRTSSFGGAGAPSTRVVLVGSESPTVLRNFHNNLEITLLSEVVEFALSLTPTTKGSEPFQGLPHLQAYKFIRAAHLAEMGYVEIANRYCEAIGTVIRNSSRGSPFFTPTFVGELKNLSDRLTAAPQFDTTASWISRKMAKPSLDTIGSWLEGRLTKFIGGESEDAENVAAAEKPYSAEVSGQGPFSHYSAISSAAPSPSPSPASSLGGTATSDYKRASMSFSSFTPVQPVTDRSSSAMDHLRPQASKASPVPRVASANAATTTFAQAQNSYGQRAVNSAQQDDGQEATWWGSGYSDLNGRTPTATTFHQSEESEEGGEFMSLMDSPGMTPMAPTSKASYQGNGDREEEDDDDLGLGNARGKPRIGNGEATEETHEQASSSKPQAATKTPIKPELKSQGSWLSRWWYKNPEPTASPGPVRANLGEETSFYFDKEQKRWVNKKAGSSDASPSPTPPPPPSRPMTASPKPGTSPSYSEAPPSPLGAGPPPRPASAAAAPPRKPPRVRSNLVPDDDSVSPGSAPPTASAFDPSSTLAPPASIGRPKSSASKKGIRNRYVDVFQQPSS